jgi:hypothetical protein
VGKGGRCIGLTTVPPSCAAYLKIWESQPPGTLWACKRPLQEFLYLNVRLVQTNSILDWVQIEINQFLKSDLSQKN